MKVTWFGGITVRIYIGGEILLIDPDGAHEGRERAELLAGVDRKILPSELQGVDLGNWQPRRAKRLLDDDGTSNVEVWGTESGGVVLDAPDEPSVLLFPKVVTTFGRWADGAVMVLAGSGEELVSTGRAILAQCRPRLVALAADDAALDHAISALRTDLQGASLVALEQGMPLEV